MTKKDVGLVLSALGCVGLAGMAGLALPRPFWMLPPALAMVTVIISLVMATYRRLNRNIYAILEQSADLARRSHLEQLIASRQTEALMSLYQALQPSAPFPNVDDAAAAPDVLNHLAQLIFMHKPAVVLETGSGLSTLILAYALKRVGRGKLISLEHDKKYADYTRGLLAIHHLEDVATVYDAPLTRHAIRHESWSWYDLSGVQANEAIDLLFVDGPVQLDQPLVRYPALPLLCERLSPTAIIVMDDAARKDEQEIVARWQAEFGPMPSTYLRYKKGACLLQLDKS